MIDSRIILIKNTSTKISSS